MKRALHAVLLTALVAVVLAAPVLGQAPVNTGQVYIVQRGDTLFRIALNHNSTVEAFAALNGISNPALIFVGQQLRIPGAEALAPAPVLPAFVTPVLHRHAGDSLLRTVEQGDTLSEIADEYGLALDALVVRNRLENASLIHVGQTLHIPGLLPRTMYGPWPGPASALQIAPGELVEGESVRLVLQTAVPARVRGSFLGSELEFIADEGARNHLALAGVPLGTAPGPYVLEVVIDDGATETWMQWPLQVAGGIFGREALQLPAEALDLLDSETENAEAALLQHITSAQRPGRWFDGLLLRPTAGRITSRFGALRSYNGGSYDRLHRGVDFAPGTGTPVRAAADGVVALAQELNIRGLSIMLDHGLGVYTGYWHLSEMDVQVGDFLRAGETLGAVGNSGRSTGAHLHWGLWVNGVAVDPLQWLHSDFTALVLDEVQE